MTSSAILPALQASQLQDPDPLMECKMSCRTALYGWVLPPKFHFLLGRLMMKSLAISCRKQRTVKDIRLQAYRLPAEEKVAAR